MTQNHANVEERARKKQLETDGEVVALRQTNAELEVCLVANCVLCVSYAFLLACLLTCLSTWSFLLCLYETVKCFYFSGDC